VRPTPLISGLGRFGNSIIQLANAVGLALHIRAAQIVFFRSPILQSGGAGSPTGLSLRKHTLRPQIGLKAPTALWRSDFIEGWPNPVALDDTVMRTFRDDVLPSLDVPEIEDYQSGEVLTVHLRSGDVYSDNPHPGYGQPPLSFYQAILGLERWSEVRLVSEDQESPCWKALVETCATQGIPLRQMGQSLDEALIEVASSANLVASRGTFIPAILFLFPKARRVFFFGPDFEPLDTGHALELIECKDVGEQYTQSNLAGNWNNTAAQRELMLNYPSHFLKLSARPR
jgi:hypothetical protein